MERMCRGWVSEIRADQRRHREFEHEVQQGFWNPPDQMIACSLALSSRMVGSLSVTLKLRTVEVNVPQAAGAIPLCFIIEMQ
jgi:hypothetical protein